MTPKLETNTAKPITKTKSQTKYIKELNVLKQAKRKSRCSWGGQGTGCLARSFLSPQHGNPTGGFDMVWLASAFTQDKVWSPRDPGGTKVRNTFPHGRVANPSRMSGRVTVSQDAFHIGDFAANPTARHCLEVSAVSQGLCPKFLLNEG